MSDHTLPTDDPPSDFTFPRVIDATIRSDWLSCPHKFFRRHIQGLVKDRPSVHLHFGACFARGLEVARRTYFTSRDTKDALVDGCEAAIDAWGDFEPPAALTRSEANKTLGTCLLALQEYFREWPLDDDPVQIHAVNGLPCIEFSFALPIPGSRHPDTSEPILYAGRFDLIGQYQGGTWGLDDKTTSVDPSNDFWRVQWKLRSQFSGYAWGAREYSLPLRGFIVRGVGVLKESIRLSFALAPRPDWQVDAWLAQLQDDVSLMCEQYDAWQLKYSYADRFTLPRAHPFSQVFDHACSEFGGCTYMDLCASPTPDNWLGEYTTKFWNPLARDEA